MSGKLRAFFAPFVIHKSAMKWRLDSRKKALILDIKKWQIVIVETASGNAHFESSLVSTENIDVFTLKGPQNCAQISAHHPSLSTAFFVLWRLEIINDSCNLKEDSKVVVLNLQKLSFWTSKSWFSDISQISTFVYVNWRLWELPCFNGKHGCFHA